MRQFFAEPEVQGALIVDAMAMCALAVKPLIGEGPASSANTARRNGNYQPSIHFTSEL